KKLTLFLLLFLLLCLSCASTQTLERKKAAGDYTVAIYNYDWEKVYDAMKFVWRHSEDWLISMTYANYDIDYAKEEKKIWIKVAGFGVDMGIFFEPQDKTKTRVVFVLGGASGGLGRGMKTRRFIDETHFYLENGEEAYRKYTHEEMIKRKKARKPAL
ncbi:hypothetical protein C6A37_07035, partial [Desulfobacteraceae bacterium SEEP-SAG9]